MVLPSIASFNMIYEALTASGRTRRASQYTEGALTEVIGCLLDQWLLFLPGNDE